MNVCFDQFVIGCSCCFDWTSLDVIFFDSLVIEFFVCSSFYALFYRKVSFVFFYSLVILCLVGGAVASWLVRLTPERAVRVGALAGDSVLCSWARHFTLKVPLSTQVINGYLLFVGET